MTRQALSELTREQKDEILMAKPGTTIHGVTIASVTGKTPHKPESESEKKEQKGLNLIKASTIDMKVIHWLWHGWLPRGKVTILAGRSGEGKTNIAMNLAAAISTGGKLPDGSRAPKGDVVIWSSEDEPSDVLNPRLTANEADLERILYIGDVDKKGERVPFDPAIHINLLKEALEQTERPLLFIIDPIVSAVKGDDHKNNEVRRGLQPIVDLATDSNIAVIGITHFKKGSGEGSPLEWVVGSIAYGAVARAMWGVTRQTDSEGNEYTMLVNAKSSYAKNGDGYKYAVEGVRLEVFNKEAQRVEGIYTSKVVWGELMEGSAYELMSTEEQEGKSALDEAKEFLFENLTDMTPSKDIENDAKQLGISLITFRRARKDLGIQPKKSEGKWYLAPTENMRNVQAQKMNEEQDAQGDQDDHGGKR